MSKEMKMVKKNRFLILASATVIIVLVLLFTELGSEHIPLIEDFSPSSFGLDLPPASISDQYVVQTSGVSGDSEYAGGITMYLQAETEDGSVVDLSLAPMAFYLNETRVKSLILTITWETYDVRAGMDLESFVFEGNVTVYTNCTSEGELWEISPRQMNPLSDDISSQTLNSSSTWQFNLRTDPLNLVLESGLHPSSRTDFAIRFDLVWYASMYDAIDEVSESTAGALSVGANMWYSRGFKIKVSGD